MVCKVSNLVFWKPSVTQHPQMHQLEKTHFGFSCGWNPIQPLLRCRWVLGKKFKNSMLFFLFTFFWGFFFFLSCFLLPFNALVFFLLCSNKFIEQFATLFFWSILQWNSLLCFWCLGGAMEPLLPLFYHCKLFSKLQWLSM